MLQGFFYSQRGDDRGPTKDEFRNMAFQGILAGACMVTTYAYIPSYTDYINPGSTGERDWAERQEVYSEIAALKPILLSDLPEPHYEVKGAGKWLNTMSRRYNGKSYLFAVNNQGVSKKAKIHLDGVKKITGMYTGETYQADADGWFTIEFEDYQVEVFEYEQADYKSSHAELERFGLADKDGNAIPMINAAGDDAAFLVPENMKHAEFSIQASDYAQLYINGGKVERTGAISLDDCSEVAVKIVSEDGRFSEEKIFALRRK